jgi:peroxiredoxin/mono/diheme cytochrome c family protein
MPVAARWCRRLLLSVAILVLQVGPTLAEPAPTAKTGQKIENFTLRGPDGKDWSLADLKERKAIVVVFLGTECPINNAYLSRLVELHKTYEPRGVEFVGVNANRQDKAERVAEHAREHNLPFPVLKDKGSVVADQFGAERTPEAFVLDAERVVRYRGRIDDQYGLGFKRTAPTRNDLAEALDEVLAGKSVSQPVTPVAGCLISRAHKVKGNSTVTYAKEVSRIVQQHCQECHRPGEIGPMALLNYDDASAWAGSIREAVQDNRMPPWHADPKYGKFENDRRLSPTEREALLAWIDQGCPKGDDKDLPPPRQFITGWGIEKPDAVFTMPKEFTVPASQPGGVPYQGFVVSDEFKEDTWVQAAEARPGNRAVVHHIIVYVIDTTKRRQLGEDGIGNGFLVAYAPGESPLVLPPGMAKKIPKGHKLVFQMHYTPNGTEQTDRSSVGLIYAKQPPTQEVRTRSIAQRSFAIPPGDSNYKVESKSTFQADTQLLSFFPHMHFRGKDFEYRAIYPDGKTETFLSVPRYEFGWQTTYRLGEPLKLPKGTRIECTAHFDNSANNLNNPDPKETVRWGDQTWEEMMIGFVDYVYTPGSK